MTAEAMRIERQNTFFSDLTGAGEDLRYDAEYMDLKSSISSGDFDPAQALVQCEALLSRSKDWRLAAYAVLCATLSHQADKFSDMLHVLHDLIVYAYDESYPQSLTQKQTIMTWLNQSYVAQVIESQDFLTLDHVHRGYDMLESMHNQLQAQMGDDVVLLVNLKNILDKKKSSLQKPSTFQKVSDGLKQLVSRKAEEIDDPAEAFNDLKHVHTCFLNAKWFLKAMNLSRVIRWSDIRTPAHDGGKTGLAPVRKEEKARLNHLISKKQYEEALTESEKVFMQAGGQYDLDIQRMAHVAASGLKDHDMTALIESHLRYFQHRVPECRELKYNDNTPCCDDQTLGWLSQFNAKTEDAIATSSHPFEAVEGWLLTGDHNKVEQFMDDYVPRDRLDHFWMDYLTLYRYFLLQDWTFCQIASNSLHIKIEQAALYEWSPTLTQKIWRLSHQILMRQKASHGKPTAQWQSQWAALQEHVTRFDMPYAAKLIQSSS